MSYGMLNSSCYVFWGGMQVPMFILIQSFHVFKHKHYFVGVKKMLSRILLPFIESQILILIFLLIFSPISCNELCSMFTHGGGLGPGSYYCSIYLQIAFLCPLLRSFFKKYTLEQMFLPFILVCQAFEIFFSVIDMPEWIYRLLSVRYLFLIYLGMIWAKRGAQCSPITLILSLIGILSICFFAYSDANLEPFFFTTNWKTHRWPCYFYGAFFLVWVLRWIYNMINQNGVLTDIYKKIASCSYEIYLVQMGLFVVANSMMINLQSQIFIIPANLCFCVLGGMCFRKYVVIPTQKVVNAI